MKFNLSKSWVVPLGISITDVPPNHSRFKRLTPSDHERLLGVPVTLTFDPGSAWDVIASKMADSIKHWTSQNLSIFGRVHAARIYVGSKSWYLATMIPPKSKCLEKLTAMLWSFLQTNSNKEPGSSSNRYYLPWSKNLLIQPLQDGGLNAQDYEAQLTATLAKWIFKLICDVGRDSLLVC
jgi:hypothetical protein